MTLSDEAAAPVSVRVMLQSDRRLYRVWLESLTDSWNDAVVFKGAFQFYFELWLISTQQDIIIIWVNKFAMLCYFFAVSQAAPATKKNRVISFQMGTENAFNKGAGLRLTEFQNSVSNMIWQGRIVNRSIFNLSEKLLRTSIPVLLSGWHQWFHSIPLSSNQPYRPAMLWIQSETFLWILLWLALSFSNN